MISLLIAVLVLLLICYLVARFLDQTIAVILFVIGVVVLVVGNLH
jgi:hypothetical protein